jgi:membrane-associated protein
MVIAETLLSFNRSFYTTSGYILVFVLLFVESLPFIGAFIPGGIIILFLGGFISRWGFMNLWVLIGVAFCASISIDTFSYLLGRYSGEEFLQKHRKYLLVRKTSIERIGRIVHGHTGKALVFGRLNPVTRAIAPFIVGTQNVKATKFMIFNVIGGALWVTLFAFLGYIFGNHFLLAKSLEKWIVGVTIALAVGFYGYYLYYSYAPDKTGNVRGKLGD